MEKKNKEYLRLLRQVMKEHNIDGVIISGTDPHQSENAPMHWRTREWITGFWAVNGTNGTAVVTQDKALCWTDSRYFIQAEEQLQGTGFEMMKEDGPEAVDLVEWVAENMPQNSVLGIDGTTFSISVAKQIEDSISKKEIKFVTNFCPFDEIYPDRPSRPLNKIFVHDEQIVGETVDSKANRILEKVNEEGGECIVLSALDDIAWATNLRTANDIFFSPMYVSYLYLEKNRRILFVDQEKLTDEVSAHLNKYNFEIMPYESVYQFISTLPSNMKLLIDPNKTSRSMFDNISCQIVFGDSKVAKLKSIKNESMLRSIDTAMEKDGVALTKFFVALEKEFPKGELSELKLSEMLRSYRMADKSCVDESFAAILGFKEHGAIIHYEPTEESDIKVNERGLLLVDSGGQYIYGTTDITRTVILGEPTEEEMHDFTLVMKGHIAIATAIFPEGTTGHQLDAMARQYLWEEGKAYFHGTGHGVGFFINCHEGPQSIRLNINPTPLEVGMISSNEPGIYYEGKYGIRCENLIVTVPAMETEFGKFFKFKTVTLFPFDLRLFETKIMSDKEINWINEYHAMVRERLSPYLNDEEKAWIEKNTQPLTR